MIWLAIRDTETKYRKFFIICMDPRLTLARRSTRLFCCTILIDMSLRGTS